MIGTFVQSQPSCPYTYLQEDTGPQILPSKESQGDATGTAPQLLTTPRNVRQVRGWPAVNSQQPAAGAWGNWGRDRRSSEPTTGDILLPSSDAECREASLKGQGRKLATVTVLGQQVQRRCLKRLPMEEGQRNGIPGRSCPLEPRTHHSCRPILPD